MAGVRGLLLVAQLAIQRVGILLIYRAGLTGSEPNL